MIVKEKEKVKVEDHMRLAKFHAFKFTQSTGYEFDDLLSEALFGLFKATESFDESRGVTFGTYASRVIINEILMYLRKERRRTNDGNVMSIDNALPHQGESGIEKTFEELYATRDTTEQIAFANFYREFLTNPIDEKGKPARKRDKHIMRLILQGYNQREIGNSLGLSQSYVSRLVSKYTKLAKEEWSLKTG